MRTTTEVTDTIGAASRTRRTIMDTAPWYWRAAMWGMLIQLGGGLALMGYVILYTVAKRHGWVA